MERDKALRTQLIALLEKAQAHVSLEDALKDITPEVYSVVPGGLPYSIWQLVEHIRIAQWDILDFSRNPDYKEMKWPEDYWPKETAPKDLKAWNQSLQLIRNDLNAFIELIKDESNDLYAPFPWGSGQNLLREALLIADHNAYHAGEIVLVRRLLNAWK